MATAAMAMTAPQTFDDVLAFMGGKPYRKLGRHTTAHLSITDGKLKVGVVYYDTVILSYTREGITFNAGDWAEQTISLDPRRGLIDTPSASTKGRFNALTPYYVSQVARRWYIGGMPFENGVTMPWPAR